MCIHLYFPTASKANPIILQSRNDQFIIHSNIKGLKYALLCSYLLSFLRLKERKVKRNEAWKQQTASEAHIYVNTEKLCCQQLGGNAIQCLVDNALRTTLPERPFSPREDRSRLAHRDQVKKIQNKITTSLQTQPVLREHVCSTVL